MKKNLFKALSLTLALTVGIATFTGCGDKNYTKNNKEFFIGGSGPLSGGAAAYGEAVDNGAKLAVDEINANGGLDGVQFKFKMYDDMHDQTKVQTGFASQFEAGMQVSLGGVTSKPCLQYKESSKEENVFFITPSATHDSVPKYDNGYQMCFSDSTQGAAIAKYITENVDKSTNIGVFYKNDDDYSKGVYNKFKEELGKDWGGYTVKESQFSGDSTSDFNSNILALKDCSFIFMPIYYKPAAAFITQAKDKLSNPKTIYFGGDGLDGVDGELGDNFATIKQGISYISHFNSKATEGKAKEFIDNYKKKYNSEPIQFAAAAYDCVYAIFNAMKTAKANGKSIDVTISASDLCEILKEVFQSDSFTFTGVTGTNMKWNQDGTVDTKTKVAVSYVIKDVTE